jgi:XTP/dITP diphosphohydrolase
LTADRIQAVVCTGNAHKVEELSQLLDGFDLEPLPAGSPSPEETGDTFQANAEIKAHAGRELAGDRWVVADDSGLCVDALDGAPGVHSARFAGADASDEDNNALLLRTLEHLTDPEERRARFVCVLVAIDPAGRTYVAEGSVEGTIADGPAGDSGFGYDPLFIPDGYDRTFGELGPHVKEQLSHRARAARHLAELVAQ